MIVGVDARYRFIPASDNFEVDHRIDQSLVTVGRRDEISRDGTCLTNLSGDSVAHSDALLVDYLGQKDVACGGISGRIDDAHGLAWGWIHHRFAFIPFQNIRFAAWCLPHETSRFQRIYSSYPILPEW